MKRSLLVLFCLMAFSQLFAQRLEVVNLTCEYKRDPLGIERSRPSLGWQLQSKERGVMQTAYRIIVADNPELLLKNIGNIWDSQKVPSDASVQVPYSGASDRFVQRK